MRLAPLTPLLRRVARERRCALDDEQSGNDVQAFQRDRVAGAGGVHEASSSVAPTAGALAADAFEEAEYVGAVALHGTREVFAQETFDAVRVAARRIEERNPTGIRPAPHGAAADAIARGRIENRDAGGVGAEQAWGARLLFDELGHGREQVDRRSDASSECLRGDVDPRAREAGGLPLDRLVLQVLVADSFDDERVAEFAALDDLRGHGCRDDRVVLGAGHGLVEAFLDHDARGDHIEQKTARVTHSGHLRAAAWTDAQLGRHPIEDLHALEACRRRTASRMPPSPAFSFRLRRLAAGFRSGDRDPADQGKYELSLEALEGFRARARSAQVRQLPDELRVDPVHAREERDDRGDHLHEPQ